MIRLRIPLAAKHITNCVFFSSLEATKILGDQGQQVLQTMCAEGLNGLSARRRKLGNARRLVHWTDWNTRWCQYEQHRHWKGTSQAHSDHTLILHGPRLAT